jgi:hypothetical protein
MSKDKSTMQLSFSVRSAIEIAMTPETFARIVHGEDMS